ncbi:hypothetical protein LEMLEM_LOCUS6540, partial [Lemmus lemmus]
GLHGAHFASVFLRIGFLKQGPLLGVLSPDAYLLFNLELMPAGDDRRQKRAPDLITDGCEPPCGCRELNSGPPEEQLVLLTTEPSLQPASESLKKIILDGTKLLPAVCSPRVCHGEVV